MPSPKSSSIILGYAAIFIQVGVKRKVEDTIEEEENGKDKEDNVEENNVKEVEKDQEVEKDNEQEKKNEENKEKDMIQSETGESTSD